MPSSTAAPLSLPYPVAADDNDVPADLQALADRIALILAAGGDIEVGPRLRDYSETVVAHGATGAAEDFDASAGNVHTATLDANCTVTLSNPPPAGRAGTITLILTQDATGNRTVTWPAAVKWPSATAPTLSGAAKVDVITLVTVDAGVTWYGFAGGLNF